ncbi:tetratricopeptide repeat protein [Pseudodesulfovibrio sp.]|nr:tetratricopeptide repeat protein [Pseudodesulfovibrio sp.]
MRHSLQIFFISLLLVSAGCVGSFGSSGTRPSLTEAEVQTQQREAQAADVLDKAMQLYHNGEFLDDDAALAYLNEAIELDPTLITARFQRAILFMEQGKPLAALPDTEAVLEEKPEHIQARFTRGFIRFQLGENLPAIKDFSAVLDQDDTISEAFAMRGSCYANLGRFNDAVHDFTQTIALNPAHQEAYYNRGMAHMELGYNVRAAHDLTQAVSLDAHSIQALMARATVYMKLSQFDRAVADFKRLIALTPNDSGMYALLGEAYAGDGEYSNARDAAHKAQVLARAEGDDNAASVYGELIDTYRLKELEAASRKAKEPVAEPEPSE